MIINILFTITMATSIYFLVDSLAFGDYFFSFLFGLSITCSLAGLHINNSKETTSTFKEEYKLEVLNGGQKIKIRNQQGKIYTCKPNQLDSILTIDNL